jgi:hypothetical protein
MKEWSSEYKYCRECYKTTHKHVFLGYCKKCYDDMENDSAFESPKIKIRHCLKCDAEFYSKSSGNRRCDICLRKESNSTHIDKNKYRVSIS